MLLTLNKAKIPRLLHALFFCNNRYSGNFDEKALAFVRTSIIESNENVYIITRVLLSSIL